MKYYVIEHQKRKDGEVNATEVSRSTLPLALSYYYERYSKMIVNTEFVTVSLMLVDEELNVVEKNTFGTQAVLDETE